MRKIVPLSLCLLSFPCLSSGNVLFADGFERGDASAWGLSWQLLPPDNLIEEWGTLEAGYERVDESPFSPDGLETTGFADGSYLVFGFQDPSFSLTGSQSFVLFVRTSSEQPDKFSPLVSVSLYEDGGLVSELGTQAVTEVEGQLIQFEWDSGLLSGNGEGVEVRVGFTHQIHFFAVPVLGAVSWAASGE